MVEQLRRFKARRYQTKAVMGGGDDYCISPSQNVLFDPLGRSVGYTGPVIVVGKNGSRIMFPNPAGVSGADTGHAGLGNGTTAGLGNITGTIALAMLILGSGPVYIDGAARGISASTALQLLLYRNGSYSDAGSGPFNVGIDPVAAPVLSASATASSIMTGAVYSIRIWPIRTVTGGRARASSPSNLITITGTKVVAGQFPAIPTGCDRWGIAGTAPGWGATGPHYKLPTNLNGEVLESALATIGGVPRAVTLEWSGGDLIGRPLAPTDDYPPPAGVWVVGLNDAIAVIGCYGDPVLGATAANPGTAISVSMRVYVESFVPDWLLIMPQKPVDVLQATDNFAFIGTADYLLALSYTGGKPPMALQMVWKGTGIAAPGNMAIGEGGRLYVFTRQKGLVRIGPDGKPDNSFATPVEGDLAGFTAENVRLGFDPSTHYFLVGHQKKLLAFDTRTPDTWMTPLDLTGKVTGDIVWIVTAGGKALIATNDGTTVRLYNFSGLNNMTAELYYPPFSSPNDSATLTQIRQRVRTNNNANPLTTKIYRQGVLEYTKAVSLAGLPVAPLIATPADLPLDIRAAKDWQVYQSQPVAGDDTGFDDVTVWGEPSDVRF